jgi:prepilin peptidase CpaA
MNPAATLFNAVIDHWHVWLLSGILVLAAVIDGWKLKVPNWLTFPLVIGGWTASAIGYGWAGLAWSLAGTAVGLALLLPAYAIGGMGAGDVKLLAGVGAWVWGTTTFYAFCVSAIVGGVLAVGMVLVRGQWRRHAAQFLAILYEILLIRSPSELSAIAAERKPSMMLLPYGIPIALGTIAYFMWSGMLI